jgi:predicted phosphodiesterase
MKQPNTLVIGDTHLPFTHRHYLDFCVDTARKYKVKRICHVGDLVDHHAISFHDHDPDGFSPGDELAFAKKAVKPWFKAFPRVDSAIGNHDALIQRKAFSNGIPAAFLKSFGDAYGAPKGWRFDFEFRYDNWMLSHGTGTSGDDAAFKAAKNGRASIAQGHIHSAAGVKYHANSRDIVWGMQVGCGLDRKSYAFSYGRDTPAKPILGCGVVVEGGRVALFVPMPM